MIFSRRLAKPGHSRRFLVQQDPDGWLALEENDGSIVRQVSSRNWNRIESQMAIFDLKADFLMGEGWQELNPQSTVF